MSKIQLLILLLISNLTALAQQDFNNYKTLHSQGPIPADFSVITSEKVKSDIAKNETTLKGERERIFLEGIHYSIDEILQSNVVVYGDEISKYVSEVADKLLKDDPALRSSLRFYTLKSNHANALSTGQGIIFVTTGLISQLTSEAQLAYILAHEISHYTEKHVIESFEFRSNRRNLYIDKLSIYSKEKELEADKLAISLYNKAGYSSKEVERTFDVLMYSYLPFDEVEFPHDYFNTSQMYVPGSVFPDKKFEIKAEEDVDDTRSSHPNIKKRKTAASEAIESAKNWGEAINSLGKERFEYIRNIARFESIRNDVIDASFTKALYSIFLLEKEFPESLYLDRMKAQAWLGMAQFKSVNGSLSTESKVDEGEIASLHKMLKGIGEVNILSMALRVNYDLHKQYPKNEEFGIIYERTLKTAAYSKKFKLEEFSTRKFSEVAASFQTKDTSGILSQENASGSSKYDKIKSKKNPDAIEAFDTLKFGFYGIGDIIADAAFLEKYNAFKAKLEKEEKEEDAYRDLSRAEKKKKAEKELHLGLKRLIVVEPSVVEYSRKRIDHERSEELAMKLNDVVEDVGAMLDVPMESLSTHTLADGGTQDFNDRSVLYSSVEQAMNYGEIDFFPVDYHLLSDIQQRRDKSTALFVHAEHQYEPEISWGMVGLSVLFIPTLPFTLVGYVVPKMVSGHQSEFTFLIVDLEKGQVVTGKSVLFHEPMTKGNMGAHFYTSLKQLITPASK